MTDEIENTQDKVEDAEVQTQTIDDLFEDKPEKSEESKGDTEESTEAKAEEEKTDADKAKETTVAETPAAKEESVPVKALTEERRKRQEAEARTKELEAQLSKQSPEPEKVPDPIDDPQGYAKFMEDKANQDALRTKVSLSRDIMLDLKEDYEEKEKVFMDLVKTNPYLVQQMNASSNPAKFAYNTAAEHLETQKVRDPKYLEEMKAKWKEEFLAELKQQEGKPDKKSALDVPDLTKATAAGKNSDIKEREVTHVNDVMQDSPF